MASAEPDVGSPPRQTLEAILMAASRSMRRAYDHRLAGVGLKPSEAFLLSHVHTRGPMSQTQLAEGLGIGRAATGALIDALESKELVERTADAADRRVWLVASTGRAAALVHEVAALDDALRAEMWNGISRAERRTLSEILLRLQGNLAAIVNDQI